MLTSSKTSAQAPPSIVQRKTFKPVAKPETDVVARISSAKVPLPLVTVQIPPVAAVALSEVAEEQMV